MNGLTPDQWIYLFSAYIGIMIMLILIMKARSRGKIPCLVLKPSKTWSIQRKKPEGNKLDFKNWRTNPEFDTEDIYTEEKAGWKFWRLPMQLIILGFNNRKALKWKSRGQNELSSIWDDKELQKYIAKMVAKARAKGQIISNTWGIMIVMLLILILFLTFMGFNRIGAF